MTSLHPGQQEVYLKAALREILTKSALQGKYSKPVGLWELLQTFKLSLSWLKNQKSMINCRAGKN